MGQRPGIRQKKLAVVGLLIIAKSQRWGLLNFLQSQRPSWIRSCKIPSYQSVTSKSGCPVPIFSYFLSLFLFSPIFKLKPPIFLFFSW